MGCGLWTVDISPDGLGQIASIPSKKNSLRKGGVVAQFHLHYAPPVSDIENESSIKTFPRVSIKDSIRIIMALVAHYDIELLQTDFKTKFLNGNLKEDVYMAQLEGFVVEGKEHLACHLKISIYGLKQASREC